MAEGTPYDVTNSQVRFTGRVISLVSDDVVMPDGATVTRDYLLHPGAVGIVALDTSDRVLLVHQYRHPVRRKLWELPAGLLDVDGEPPLAAARRELHEEGAITADRWDLLIDLFESPGCSDEAMRIFLARGVNPVAEGDRHVGEAEEAGMELRWVDLDEAITWATCGRILNATCSLGLLAAASARTGGWSVLRPADSAWPPPVDP